MGIDQLELHSVQIGYLKILQMGSTDPKDTKAGKEIRGSVSRSQLDGRHSNGSHHSNDSIGLFRHNTSVGQSQRGSKSGHQSINLSQDVLRATLQCRLRPPSKYQSQEQLKKNPAPLISFKTTARIDRNLEKKCSGEQ
ncbi:Replication protein A 70 kDa, Meiotic and somatic DNA repair [Dorcoceras hygrometricum]|uniref:Replication protein A 70 kDa, Meiotic and somatic DNA repair n=1 Tax=Dorcoceras hygrometricum TaxID=472368 RepID=A0A2Z7CVG1_9LAMI|nr:Replication protein A 70 kDa, Meiotic and somatic DNA repair [Dorcoceras hygrometricum]